MSEMECCEAEEFHKFYFSIINNYYIFYRLKNSKFFIVKKL